LKKKKKSKGGSGPSYVVEPLRPLCVPITSLKPDPKNVRTHDERNLDAIRASMEKFGQRVPLVVGPKGIILKGNGTFEVAKQLGWEQIAAVQVKDSKEEQIAFSIIDNRAGELAEWDHEGLMAELKVLQTEGMNLEDLGWLEHEVELLHREGWSPPALDDLPTKDEEGKDAMPSVKLSKEQRAVIEKAVEKMRGKDKGMTEGKAVSLICKGYLKVVEEEVSA